MTRMVLLTFAFLGWAWFELSGGTDFVPGDNGVTLLARVETAPEPATPTDSVAVARADTSAAPLTDVTPSVVLEPEPQKVAALSAAAVLSDASPEPVPAAIPANEAVLTEPAPVDYRSVSGNRVNLRFGPGTDYAVVINHYAPTS